MKPRPPLLAFLQEPRGNWAKLPYQQEGPGAPVPGPGGSSSSLRGLGMIRKHCKPQLLHLRSGDANNPTVQEARCRIKRGNTCKEPERRPERSRCSVRAGWNSRGKKLRCSALGGRPAFLPTCCVTWSSSLPSLGLGFLTLDCGFRSPYVPGLLFAHNQGHTCHDQ